MILSSIGARCGKTFLASGQWTSLANTQIMFPHEGEVDARYLWYLTNDEWLWPRSGSAQPFIKPRDGKTIPVPVPPIATQRAIVARIDALFCELDDGEEELRRARVELETYRKSLLKAAVTGELTADWRAVNPPQETGADFLARILDDRRARWEAEPKNKGKRYKQPPPPEGELLFGLPIGWTCASLGQIGDIVTGATPATGRPDFYNGDVPFFTPGDLDAGEVRMTKRTLTETGRDSVRSVPAGSVLVTCIGATIGKLAIAGSAGATNQQINSVIPAVAMLSGWIHAFLSSPWGQQEILERSSSTTMPILNKGDFSRLPIPLPPIDEIGQLSSILRVRLEERQHLHEAVNDLRASPPALRRSILAAAFRGDLVQ